jgi:ABC-type branched-subunit amino acid transport system ATPase component
MLDEPSSGLDRAETSALGAILMRVVAARGAGVLLVEHDLDLVRQVTERLYVLDLGQMLTGGVTADVLDDVAVRQAYLGHTP